LPAVPGYEDWFIRRPSGNYGWNPDVSEASEHHMEITPVVVAVLAVIGWAWTLRAGATMQRYRAEPTPRRKKIAIGNALVSLVPLALAVWLAWPR